MQSVTLSCKVLTMAVVFLRLRAYCSANLGIGEHLLEQRRCVIRYKKRQRNVNEMEKKFTKNRSSHVLPVVALTSVNVEFLRKMRRGWQVCIYLLQFNDTRKNVCHLDNLQKGPRPHTRQITKNNKNKLIRIIKYILIKVPIDSRIQIKILNQ